MTNNSCWDRLLQIIEDAGLSIHSFSKAIGLKRSETLYQIQRGQIQLSSNVADLIIARYPDYSKKWLLTGIGSIYANHNSDNNQIPFYDIDLLRLEEIDDRAPSGYMHLPQIGDADFAILYHGEDMLPSIPRGSTLVLKQHALSSVLYGNEYVIKTDHVIALRKVRYIDGIYVRLEACNRELFDDIIIPVREITDVYAVRAKIIIKD